MAFSSWPEWSAVRCKCNYQVHPCLVRSAQCDDTIAMLFVIYYFYVNKIFAYMFRFAAAAAAAAKYFAQVAQVVLVSGRISDVAYFFFFSTSFWQDKALIIDNEFHMDAMNFISLFSQFVVIFFEKHSSRSLNVRIFSPANTIMYRCYSRSLLVLFIFSLPIPHHT